MLHWQHLENMNQYVELLKSSNTKPFAIFKHSTRCSVSSMAKKKLEYEWHLDVHEMPVYYLDLLRHREISDRIAYDLDVQHKSPQLIVVKNGVAIYNESHGDIEIEKIKI